MIRVKKLETGSYSFNLTPLDDDGNAVTPATPRTFTVYDGAGAQLATGSATFANDQLTATISSTLITKLDTLDVKFTCGASEVYHLAVEIVGGYLFEIAELRAMDRAFTDTVKYPTATLRQVRTWVEQTIEGPRAAQVAFVPRHTRIALNGNSPDLNRGFYPLMYGNDYRDLICPDFQIRSVYSASINGTALTQTELDDIDIDDNVLHRSAGVQWPAWPWGKGNIELHYEHGFSQTPGAITRAALMLAREYLVKSDIPNRATATSIGDQLFRVSVAGRDGVTGIPEVDAAISQFGRAGYGIG